MVLRIRLGSRVGVVLLAMVFLWLCPQPLWACSDRTGSWWDWERCFCFWRLLVLPAVALIVLGCFCYLYLFLTLYLQQRQQPLWPREAFWRATAWYLFLMTAVLVGLLAGLSDDLRHNQWRVFPASWNWLDRNWPWMVLLLVGAGLAFTLVYFTKRKRTSEAAAAR